MKKKSVYPVIVLLVLATLISGCGLSSKEAKEARKSSDPIVEAMLTAMTDNDYAKFSAAMDSKMKSTLTEKEFRSTNATIKSKIGDYVSKSYSTARKEQGFTSIYYKAKFSKENNVSVKLVLNKTGGKNYVSGFWINSPKLNK